MRGAHEGEVDEDVQCRASFDDQSHALLPVPPLHSESSKKLFDPIPNPDIGVTFRRRIHSLQVQVQGHVRLPVSHFVHHLINSDTPSDVFVMGKGQHSVQRSHQSADEPPQEPTSFMYAHQIYPYSSSTDFYRSPTANGIPVMHILLLRAPMCEQTEANMPPSSVYHSTIAP